MINKSTTISGHVNNQLPAAEKKELPENKLKAEIIRIPIDDIEPNPRQPRSEFNEQDLKDLAETIKHHDLIQPVSVSKLPNGKYRLIAGERRWRAAKLASLKDIPAYVRETDETHLLELAILENLHRKNLLPMEQARAFRLLAEECGMNTKEIALRNGKTEYFVRQQIKLTELIPQWQKIVSKDGIPLTIALQIAVLPESAQKELYQNEAGKEAEKSEKPGLHITQHTINKYKGILAEASFDINDTNLDTKMGACTSCPLNTACNALFPDEEKNPRCNNIACFNNKTALHLNRELKKAMDDPTVLLVYEANYSAPDYIKKLKGEGLQILKLGYGDDCTEMKEPKKPDWKEYEKWAKFRNHSDNEIKKGFENEKENYEFKKEAFDKNVASGKYKKAFVVYADGRQTGKYVYVQMNVNKKPTAKSVQDAIKSGTAATQDVDNEITRLTQQIHREAEIGNENVQKKIVQSLKDCKAFHELPKTGSRVDNVLITFFLFEYLCYYNPTAAKKIIKLPEYKSDNKTQTQYYKGLESFSRQQVSYIIRQIIFDKYGNYLSNTKEGFIVRKMAESLGLVPISTFEKEQNEIVTRKKRRLIERIDELNKHKQKLTLSSKKISFAKAIETKSKSAA